jgi:hypothetical protein
MTYTQTIALEISYIDNYHAKRAHKIFSWGEFQGAMITLLVDCTETDAILQSVKERALAFGGVYQMREQLI